MVRTALLAVVIGVSSLVTGDIPLPAPASEPPAVRGHVYDNPALEFSIAWEPAVWSVAGTPADDPEHTLTLTSEDGTAGFEAWRADDQPAVDFAQMEQCVADGIASLASTLTAVEPLAPISSGAGGPFGGLVAGGEWRAVPAGATPTAAAAVRVGIDCYEGRGYVRETRIAPLPDGESPWPDAFDHYDIARTVGQSGAIVDLDFQVLGEATLDQVRVTVFVENVDAIAARFDVEALQLLTDVPVPLRSYQVDDAPTGETGPLVQLDPGESLVVTVDYVVDRFAVVGACYQQGDECVVVSGCWGGCGGGSRPRLRIIS